ncbi:pilus assembly protein TadG-related protein [Streptomyces coeruleorubidus]|uniref:Pilus assembly protein TadG-related protein n=1 Tax=Streptomyces coeruleorubidus TaxID=116188 RepID=A0ABZ0KRJ1_STRC4|nr:pilus assembly protein TadG-related protein [Streptomyces coeruleorubidus]WOT40259.1 pilus assembly protein TadG-related protein [Streptomyces coeruleorubidus]
MRLRRYGDAGQAFPIYITVVGGLLFLAFAYFAVGQAAANRNGAQTAADAAALAAAQDRRDQLAGAWVKDVLDPSKWQGIFNGIAEGLGPSCGRAHQLAERNDARVISCSDQEGPLRFTVEVETNKPMGDSVVPGEANRKSNASATAVIEPRCDFEPPATDAGPDVLPRLLCEGNQNWDLDPDDLDLDALPKPEDLFDVHLAD